jgi:hypothetical protein
MLKFCVTVRLLALLLNVLEDHLILVYDIIWYIRAVKYGGYLSICSLKMHLTGTLNMEFSVSGPVKPFSLLTIYVMLCG